MKDQIKLDEQVVSLMESEKFIVAVSGGVDSMTLLHIILTYYSHLKDNMVVATINHGMRKEAYEEVAFVKKLCQQQNIPFFTNENVPQYLKSEGEARVFRYGCLKEVATQIGSQVIVTAHHLNDQVETGLMQLLRGNSLDSIAGMPIVGSRFGLVIARPLLDVPKVVLQQYAHEYGIAFFEDSTNQSTRYTRNQLRLEIMPQLETVNEQAIQHLADFQSDLSDMLHVSDLYYQQLLNTARCDNGLKIAVLRTWDSTTLQFMMSRWLREQSVLKRAHVQNIMKLLKQDDGEKWLKLSNEKWYYQTYDVVQIIPRLMKEQTDDHLNFQWDGQQPVLIGKHTLFLSKKPTKDSLVGVKKSDLPLTVRTVQSGDKMTLGTFDKKVSRIFIDEKIPRHERSSIPVLVNKQGKIIAILDKRLEKLSKRLETVKILECYVNLGEKS